MGVDKNYLVYPPYIGIHENAPKWIAFIILIIKTLFHYY